MRKQIEQSLTVTPHTLQDGACEVPSHIEVA